jgi:elongation factor P
MDGGDCYFMNGESFEQHAVAKALVGLRANFLEPEMRGTVEFVERRVVNVVFPEVIEVKIAETAPVAHHQQDGMLKPPKLANGIEVMVPQFIKPGDVIRLDVNNLKYLERARVETNRST